MAILNREAILAARDVQTIDVEVPEWGGSVRLASFSAATRLKLAEKIGKNTDPSPAEALDWGMTLLSLCIVDESGKPMFSADQLDALSEKASPVLDRLIHAARKLNGFGEDAQSEAVESLA